MSDQYQEVIRYGLKPPQNKKNVIVIGAGLAGLTTASLLKQAGHRVKILEGSHRVGGRVHTVRAPFLRGGYMEAGAMRIPQQHHCVFEYIRKFNLPVETFINETPNDILYVNGVKTRLHVYRKNPAVLQFPVLPNEKGKTAAELVAWCSEPVREILQHGSDEQKAQLLTSLSKQSFTDFFRENLFHRNLSSPAIEMIETLMAVEGFPFVSIVEVLFDLFKYVNNPATQFYEIPGGNDQLPRSFYPHVKDELLFGEKVIKIAPREQSVTVVTFNRATHLHSTFHADCLVVTVPFIALQNIEIEPVTAFSYLKRCAIKNLHYVTATKTGLEFKTRFWEKEGLYGGKMISDGPTRFTFYPSNPKNNVILGSYTWQQDTLIWDAMSEEDRVREVLKFLASIHGQHIYQEFLAGASWAWSQKPMVGGDFAVFTPYQRLEFGEAIRSPEGNVYFAGEHTSQFHGWMEGAIRSGVRAALEVNHKV